MTTSQRTKRTREKWKELDNYWLEHYCTDFCTLCGNGGVIDSRGVCTPAGKLVGRRNWCICPNGRTLMAGYNGMTAEEVFSKIEFNN